jgi:hypothetical protein
MDSQVKSHLRNLNNIAYFNLKCGILTHVASRMKIQKTTPQEEFL